MSAEIAVQAAAPDFGALQKESQFTPEVWGGVAGSGANFHPRLQLFGGSSDEVKEGKIPIAHYGLVNRDELTPLGASVLLVPYAWRSKAMDVKSYDKPVAYFRKESPEFQAIVAVANVDSQKGKMYGPEFLVWVKGHGWATFYFSSKTARNSAPQMFALLPKGNKLFPGIATAKLISNDEHKWHGPDIKSSAQIVDDLPPGEEAEQVCREFLAPVDSRPEVKEQAAPAAVVER